MSEKKKEKNKKSRFFDIGTSVHTEHDDLLSEKMVLKVSKNQI